MGKTVWLTTNGNDLQVTKTDPVSIGLNVEVTVRAGDGQLHDGVWLNGQRSFDTSVILDGVASYHSPDESDGARTFEQHEAAGGGSSL
jgi:hypothetical protein